MRIFRLSKGFFNDEFKVYRYLCKTLPNENEWYYYEAGAGKVAEDSVKSGDYHNILGIGRLDSGRLPSDDPELKYRYKFKPESVNIFPLSIKLNDLHKHLSEQGINVGTPYTERQDWPIINDSYSALVLAWLKNKVFNIYNNI